jgi:hypothetical protein
MQHRDIKQASEGDIIDRLISKRPDCEKSCGMQSQKPSSKHQQKVDTQRLKIPELEECVNAIGTIQQIVTVSCWIESGKRQMMLASSGIPKVRTLETNRENDSVA